MPGTMPGIWYHEMSLTFMKMLQDDGGLNEGSQ